MGDTGVSVVVVTYNALPWLTRALDSVRRNELIVVDHGSTDETLDSANTSPKPVLSKKTTKVTVPG
jgi:glycosyltransferase involved in cell wall biosynthesis